MCLITVCPKGTNKNMEAIESFIDRGMSSNNQGSGFAYKRNGQNEIVLSKGYFDRNDLKKALIEANLNENDELIIHHRIATSGKDRLLNTHPFIIDFDFEEITKVYKVTDKPVMAHNGVFAGYGEKIDDNFNDTVHWIHVWLSNPQILNLLKNNPEDFVKRYDKVASISYNKLAFLFPDRDLLTIGAFIEDNGYLHSNGGYKEYVYDRGGSSNSCSFQQNKRHDNGNFSLSKELFIDKDECFKRFGIIRKKHDNKFYYYVLFPEFIDSLNPDIIGQFIYKYDDHLNYICQKMKYSGKDPVYYFSRIGNSQIDEIINDDLNDFRYFRCEVNDLITDVFFLKFKLGKTISKNKFKNLIKKLTIAEQKKKIKVQVEIGDDKIQISTKSLKTYLLNTPCQSESLRKSKVNIFDNKLVLV